MSFTDHTSLLSAIIQSKDTHFMTVQFGQRTYGSMDLYPHLSTKLGRLAMRGKMLSQAHQLNPCNTDMKCTKFETCVKLHRFQICSFHTIVNISYLCE